MRRLGLGVDVELLAGLDEFLESRRTDARVQRDASALAPLPLRIEVVEPDYESLVLFHLDLFNACSTMTPGVARVI